MVTCLQFAKLFAKVVSLLLRVGNFYLAISLASAGMELMAYAEHIRRG